MRLCLRIFVLIGTLCASWPLISADPAADPTVLYFSGWEGGVGTWCAESGVWDVGVVSGTPQGTMAAATVPGGNYPRNADSRFIGPAVALPASPTDGKLWLSFYHWFSLSGGDSCVVEIGTGGTVCGAGTTWERVGRPLVRSSGHWTRDLMDISTYAGQSIRVAFHILDNNDGFQAPGWLVDSLEVLEGVYPAWTLEGFEAGYRGWHADHGSWRVAGIAGSPQGANAAVSGDNYPRYADSRLVSSPLALPDPSDGVVSLSFHHWFNLSGGDSCFVEISTGGGPWERVGRTLVRSSGHWTRNLVDLSSYKGQSVRIAFHIKDNGDGFESDGWFVDSLEIVEGGYAAWSPEGFESGYQGWHADQGVWRIKPDAGAPEGAQVASGGDNYPRYADSRLVSVSARLDEPLTGPPPILGFRHWFNLSGGDSAWVEVSAAGGPWEQVTHPAFTGSSGGWSQRLVDLTAYLGKEIRLAFHVRDNGDGFESNGWRIDELSLEKLTPVQLALASVEATADWVRLHWFVGDGSVPVAEVQRRTAGTDWEILGEIVPDGEGHMFFVDSGIQPGGRYGYRLRVGTGAAEILDGEVWVDVPTTAVFALQGLRPHPAVDEVRVSFSVATAEPVGVALFDVSGRRVLALTQEIAQPGWHTVVLGEARDVPAGLYFLQLTQGGRSSTQRACIVR